MQHYCKRILSPPSFCTRILSAAALFAGLATAAHAQTLTVAQSGSPDFTTLQAAIDHFATSDPNPSLPNVIQITDSAVYDEVITINVPVTIEATQPTRPTIAAQANAAGRAGSAGVVVNLDSTVTTDSVTLRNLVLLPSLGNIPQSSAVNVINNNVFLTLDNVLISGNNGSNGPVSTDGLTIIPADGAHVNFGDDGLYAGTSTNGEFEGEGLEILLRNTVITHMRGTVNTSSDGIIINQANTANRRILRLADGNVVSVCNGSGIVISGDLEINSPVARTKVYACSAEGVRPLNSPNFRTINGAIISGNRTGIYETSTEGVRTLIENSIIAGQSRQNLRVAGSLGSDLIIRNSTIGRQGSGASYGPIYTDTPTNIIFEDSILAGNGNNSTSNTVTNVGTGTFQFKNSATILGGDNCMTMTMFLPQFVSVQPVIKTDPLFLEVTDINSPNYYAVQSSSYAALRSDGQPLSGGAPYLGPPAPASITPQTVTVSKTSAADYTTIQDAINSLPLDNTKAYTIQILDDSLYDEMINLNVPATVIGTGLNRPVIAVQGNPAGFDNEGSSAGNSYAGDAGFLINLPDTVLTGTVALKNLIIIPSRIGTTPPVSGIVNKNNNCYIDMDNIVVTGNDGNDNPISTDGLTQVAIDPAHVHFPGCGIHLGSITNNRVEGDGVEARMRNCVITHNRYPASNVDGDLAFRAGVRMGRYYTVTNQAPGAGTPIRPNAFRWLRIEDNCRITFNINGIQTFAPLEVEAPNNRLLVYANRYMGIDMQSRKGKWLNGLTIANNTNSGLTEQSGGSGAGPRMFLKNAVIANNGWYNIYCWTGSATQTPAWLENVTLAKQSNTPIATPLPPTQQSNLMTLTMSTSGAAIPSLVVQYYAKDCIFAGHGILARTNNVINTAQGTNSFLALNNTAVVTDGPFALNTTSNGTGVLIQGNGQLHGMPITNVDPMFDNTTDPTLPNFYAVRNTDYATLSSTGGPLVGGGIYTPGAFVADWSVY